MGEEKRLKGKIIFKHETEADWAMSNYIPQNGELVLYDPDEKHEGTRLKRGDGINYVKDLPFITSTEATNILETGDGKDSIIKSISDPDTEYRANEAFSDYSAALGVSNIAGSLAFNISSYSTDGKTYTLTSALPETAINFKTGELESIDVGAEYTVILPSVNRHFHGTITAIDSTRTIITVSNLEIGNGGSDWTDTSRCCFKLVNYPLAGNVPTGSAATVFGESNVAGEFASFASGYLNNADGKYSVAIGRQNEAGWSCAAIGRQNKAHGLGSIALGLDNKTSAMGAAALNQYNNSKHPRALVAGVGNNSSKSNQTVVGQYNKDNSNALFIVGNGKGSDSNVTSRSNAFEVLKNGRATIGAGPVNPMDIVNKQYVDNVITNLDISSGLEVETPLGSSPIILDPQPAGTKVDYKFSYSDPIETDITYALYANNLLIKPTSIELKPTNISPATIVCDEYGVMTIPTATNSGGTFHIEGYISNKLFPFATSGKITVAMHTDAGNTSNTGIQLRFEVYYLENGTSTIKVHSNGQNYPKWQCTPGISKVVDLDEFTQTYGKIVGIDVSLVWNSKFATTSSFNIYPAIYRGEVDVDPLTIPQDIANSQIYKTIANNTVEAITLPEGISSIVAARPSVEISNNGTTSREVTIYKSFENLTISQVYSVSKLEAGENISFDNVDGVLTINTTGSSAGDAEMTLSDNAIEGATPLRSIIIGDDKWNVEGINTTYTLSKSGNNITLTGSDGSETSVTDSSGSSLPTENKQVGAFLRLDTGLNPVWQMIPNAEDVAF